MPDAAPTRAYRSELRLEQAQRTRRRVLEAAADEFSQRGYQATTLAAIARTARVSTETVKSIGAKSDLLVRSFEVLFAGTEGASSLTETDAARELVDAPTDELLPLVVDTVVVANARGARLWTVLLAASLSDELVADALSRMLANRRRDFEFLAAQLVEHGLASASTDTATLAAELSFVMSPESYEQLVLQWGWSDDDYRAWLMRTVRRAAAG